MDIEVSQPEPSDESRRNFATEVAFNALLTEAKNQGPSLKPVMGLMYLPDQAVTRQFQLACRAVLDSLAV